MAKKRVVFYQPDDKKYGKSIMVPDNTYCPECKQTIKLKKIDLKSFVKYTISSLETDAYQCPKCNSIFIFNLEELWHRAKEFYIRVLAEGNVNAKIDKGMTMTPNPLYGAGDTVTFIGEKVDNKTLKGNILEE